MRREDIGISGGVVICYRREDSAGFAGRIYDRLASGLGREKVFFDVDAIAQGIDYVSAISERVGKCDALVVVISPNWIRTVDVNGRRRLDDPNDFVRIEIEAALARQVPVIPVVVDCANLPKASELPESLKDLARRQGLEISDARFDSDVDRLIRALSSLMEALRQREAAEDEGATGQAGERREAVEAAAKSQGSGAGRTVGQGSNGGRVARGFGAGGERGDRAQERAPLHKLLQRRRVRSTVFGR